MNRQVATHAPKPTAVINVAGGVLQRKCACGTHTVAGGACESCRREKTFDQWQRAMTSAGPVKKMPPFAHGVSHPPGWQLDGTTHGPFKNGFGHDFSRVRVHPNAPRRAPLGNHGLKAQPESGLAQDIPLHSGLGYVVAPVYDSSGTCKVGRSESNCLPDAGYNITAINNDCCTRPCTVEHEVQHIRDFDNCCRAYSRAQKQPGADQLKIVEAWNTWREQVRPISECRAYTNDIGCAQRLAKLKGCAPETGREEKAGVLASGNETPTGESEALIEGTAQQASPDSPKFPKGVKELSACCTDIAWYEQVFRDEAAGWCQSAAGKAVPPCPFTAKGGKP